MIAKGGGVEARTEQESGTRCKLIYRMDRQPGLMYSTGTNIQYPMINHNGKEYEKKKVYIITESLCCTAIINTMQINYISIKKIIQFLLN